MMAIALAGGSIAACADAPDPAGADGAEREPMVGAHLVMRVPVEARGAYGIPLCNANPDPCCRNPDLPGCAHDAGDVDAGASAEAGDPSIDASPDASERTCSE